VDTVSQARIDNSNNSNNSRSTEAATDPISVSLDRPTTVTTVTTALTTEAATDPISVSLDRPTTVTTVTTVGLQKQQLTQSLCLLIVQQQ